MFKPSGFYRDETPEEARLREEVKKGPMGRLDRVLRPDSRALKVPHPLSFIELKRHGFADLVTPVVEMGGPFEVGKVIGIEWDEPEEVEFEV